MPGYVYRGTEPEAAPKPPRKVALKPCGTPAAYRRHIKNGEPIDPLCREQNIKACREYRQRKKATT